jgi:hypothetical protein
MDSNNPFGVITVGNNNIEEYIKKSLYDALEVELEKLKVQLHDLQDHMNILSIEHTLEVPTFDYSSSVNRIKVETINDVIRHTRSSMTNDGVKWLCRVDDMKTYIQQHFHTGTDKNG